MCKRNLDHRVVVPPAGSTEVCACMLAILLFMVSFSGAASADQHGEAERQAVKTLRITQLVEDGQCDEALAMLETERAGAPDDARLAVLQAECLLRMRQYGAALDALNEARRSDPGREDLDLYLAMANYHLEDFDAAQAAITDARDTTSDRALAHYELYRGLLLLHAGENREAALSLERARIQNAVQVEPVASYYAGLAWQSVNEREAARESFQRVIDVDGEGVWGKQARAALEGESLADRAFFSAKAGLEFDSNPVLRGQTLPTEIARQSDGRGSWFLQGGAELFRTDKWSGGLLASYAGNAHFELSQFDTHYPTGGGWIDYDLSSTSLIRLRYDAGFAWVNYRKFATTQAANASLYRTWQDMGTTEFSVGWVWYDYHFPIQERVLSPDGTTCVNPPSNAFCWPPGFDTVAAEDRDGNGLAVGALHRYDVRGLRRDGLLRTLQIRGGYAFRRYWAEGTDWDSMSHQVTLGAFSNWPWKLRTDLEAYYVYQPFDNVSSYPQTVEDTIGAPVVVLGPDTRTDQIARAEFEIERPVTDVFIVSARYFYQRNFSNVFVFDYDRHVVGAFVEFRL